MGYGSFVLGWVQSLLGGMIVSSPGITRFVRSCGETSDMDVGS